MSTTAADRQGAADGEEFEADFVVVGSGAAGLTAAITARRRGLTVIVLESQDVIGGTTARSGTWIWSPNNRWMRELGFSDERDDAVRYMARLSFSDRYRPDAERFGLEPYEYEMLNTFYSASGAALEELTAAGALDPVVRADAPDYFADLPEDKAPYGRVIVSRGRARPDQLTGAEWVLDLRDAALRLGVEIQLGHRVLDVLRSGERVTGVLGESGIGEFTAHARRGVLFATGGFTHDPGLMSDHMATPVRLGGASRGSRGDFLRIGASLGARLHNTSAAWLAPIPLEALVQDAESVTTNIFALRGDSMILVNKYGRRTVNEKLPYHELAGAMLRWDPTTAEHPDVRMFMIFDQSARAHFSDGTSGNPIKPLSQHDPHLVEGETLEELSAALRRRVRELGPVAMAGVEVAPKFADELARTIEEFNQNATTGKGSDVPSRRVVDRAFPQRTRPPRQRRQPGALPVGLDGPLLRPDSCAGDARHQGGTCDRQPRSRPPSSRRPPNPRTLRGRQLCRIPLGSGVLGGRCHDRARHGFRLPRGT
jgi:hypothetical protein